MAGQGAAAPVGCGADALDRFDFGDVEQMVDHSG
jgi:hypothetical protein